MFVELRETPLSPFTSVDRYASGAGVYAPTTTDVLHDAARKIFTASLGDCGIGTAFDRHLHFEGSTLVHHPFPALQEVLKPERIALDKFRHIRIVALGKAAIPMLDALITRLPRGLRYRAVCAAPEKPARRNWRVQSFAAGHPVPNQESFAAARAALRMLHQAKQNGKNNTFVFFLLSGGGSSLLELPLDETISLDDTIAFHEALLGCGASIHEVNIVRKHFSAVKGGRLALAAPDAMKLTLQIADVPLRNLDALASGPTIPDRSTVEECRDVLRRYQLLERFPGPVRDFFSAAHLQETPGAKPDVSLDSYFRSASATAGMRAMLRPSAGPAFLKDPTAFSGHGLSLDTLLSSHDLVNAARDRAQQLGFKVVIDNSCDDWPYDAAALFLVRRFQQLRKRHPRLCLISSGEVTVRLDAAVGGKIGTGGRNQQFALAAALVLAGEEWRLSDQARGFQEKCLLDEPAADNDNDEDNDAICILSAGTDGIDGNSPVAGAIADRSTVARARALHFEPVETLHAFDACPLFSALGDTVVTGRTGHNLRDLRLVLGGLPRERPLP